MYSSNYLQATHAAVSVGATSTSVLPKNNARQYLCLVNDSDTVIYINLGGTAALNTGIRIEANGGKYEMKKGLGDMYMGAITAISTVAGKNLLVTEGV